MMRLVEPWLKRKAEDLHEWAGNNLYTELCAEMLLASVPKPFRAFLTVPQLLELLQSPDWWQHLTTFYPPLEPYRAWVDDCRAIVIQMLQEEAGDTGSAPTPSEPPERTQ